MLYNSYALLQSNLDSCEFEIYFHYTSGLQKYKFSFDPENQNVQYQMHKIITTESYNAIEVFIFNYSMENSVYLDNIALYKEGYGINVNYYDSGLVQEEKNDNTNDSTRCTYYPDNKIQDIIVNEETNHIDYLDNETRITTDNVYSRYLKDGNGNYQKVISTKSGEVYMSSSTEYTTDSLYVKTETDIFNNVTTYTYNYLTGLVDSIIKNGVTTSYIYDDYGNTKSVTTGSRTVSYTYNGRRQLERITIDGLEYFIQYNNYGDILTITVNDAELLENHYLNEQSSGSNDTYRGIIDYTEFSYGSISFAYDDEGRIKTILYKDKDELNYNTAKEYTYNDYGSVSILADKIEGVTYYYNYDYENRLVKVNASNGNNITYEYDDENLIKETNINGINNYYYNSDNEITNETLATNKMYITYTNLTNIDRISIAASTANLITDYTYETVTQEIDGVEENINSGRVNEICYRNDVQGTTFLRFVYHYDSNNNIWYIDGFDQNGIQNYYEEFTYDIYNQLTAQSLFYNGDMESSSSFEYDSRGNITKIYRYSSEIYEFSYNIKNELQTIEIYDWNGNLLYISNVTYDSYGQPNNHFAWTLDYDLRNVVEIKNSAMDIDLSYNSDGIRTSKSVIDYNNGTTTNITYKLDGTKILQENRNGVIIKYLYNSNDELVGFIYNNITYTYLRNLQNDIIGIMDNYENMVVRYYYDAYGRTVAIDGNQTLANINSFRYRSYYFDVETGWYYLNSRYYDPMIGRFITGDAPEMVLYEEENLFRYCENNPVNNSDPYGYSNASLLLGIAGLILSLIGMFSAPRMAIIAITLGIAIFQLIILIRDQTRANNSLKKANISKKEYNRLKSQNDTIFIINLIAIVITLILSALGLRFAKTLSDSGIAIFLGIGIAQSLSIGGVCIDFAFFLRDSRLKFNYK